MTLQQLADACGCARSYLSAIENEQRPAPSNDILGKMELALGLPAGRLIEAAQWQQTPSAVKRRVAQMQDQERTGKLLAKELLDAAQGPGGLDAMYRSGQLQRLIERLAPPEPSSVPVSLPVEVPLINSVAAGYPREFTDLGYPARVADEYVRSPDIRDPDAFAARVVGDSMEPLYREGDIVIFSPARGVRSGMDCFVRLEPDHETTFKRVFFEPAPPEGQPIDPSSVTHIRLQPLNPKYPARTLVREDVAGIYAAVSVTRAV